MEDRTETLSIREHMFRDADDSVLSIIPSRQSSRVSLHTLIKDGDEASIRSSASSKFRYSRLSFENQLFTSFVYKRNYQFPHRNPRSRSPNPISKSTLPITELHTDIDAPKRSLTKQPALEEINKSVDTVLFSLILPLRDDNDIVMDNIGLSQTRELVKSVNEAHFLQACRCLSHGVDIVFLFHGRQVDEVATINLHQHLRQYDIELFATTMQRLAYTAGTLFMRQFITCYFYPVPKFAENAWVWKAIDKAAAIADAVKSLVPGRRRFSVLQLACAGGNHAVASYLLRAGFSGGPYEKALSRLKKDHQMETLLGSHSLSDRDIFTDALWQALADAYSGSIVWWAADGTPLIWTADAAIELFVRHGADIAGYGTHVQRTHAPLFDVFHAIDNADIDLREGLQLFEALLHNGAHPDALGVWKLKDTGQEVTISPLALAATLGAAPLVEALLRFGAKNFGSGSMDVLKESASNIGKLALARIHDLIADFNHSESASTADAAKILEEMESQIDLDIIHSARTSTRPYRQSQQFTQQTSSRVSSLDQTNIQVAHDPITGVVTIPAVHFSVRLNKETKANAYPEGAHILLRNILDNDFSSAIQCLREEVDLGLAFNEPSLIATLDFILHVYVVDKDLATTVCKRLAFATGGAWTRGLKCFLLQRRSDMISSTDPQPTFSKQELENIRLPVLWRDVEKAAISVDMLRWPYNDRNSQTFNSLDFAIAANDYRLAEYLLSMGIRPLQGSFEPLLSAAYNHAVSMTQLLVSRIDFPPIAYAYVFEKLIYSIVDDRHSSPPQTSIDPTWTPNPKAALEIMRTLLYIRGTKMVQTMTVRKDILHRIIVSDIDRGFQLELLEMLIQHGADVDVVAEIESTRLTNLKPSLSRTHGQLFQISTLALASVQGLENIVHLLLDEGARTLFFSIPDNRGLYLVKGHDPERQRSALQNIFLLLLSHKSELQDAHDLLHIYENAVWFMGLEQISEQHVIYHVRLPHDRDSLDDTNHTDAVINQPTEIGIAITTNEVEPEETDGYSDELEPEV
jgi:hypothetical protein